jgi:hypothetical protein
VSGYPSSEHMDEDYVLMVFESLDDRARLAWAGTDHGQPQSSSCESDWTNLYLDIIAGPWSHSFSEPYILPQRSCDKIDGVLSSRTEYTHSDQRWSGSGHNSISSDLCDRYLQQFVHLIKKHTFGELKSCPYIGDRPLENYLLRGTVHESS